MREHGRKPYKGLIPYQEEDAPLFFGRHAEQEIISANLLASRLTVLYGASGVGKSSVLRAGVAYHLNEMAQRNLAKHGSLQYAVVVCSSWHDDPLAGLLNEVWKTTVNSRDNTVTLPVPSAGNLANSLSTYAESMGGELLIVLDQFEEYFLYHPVEQGKGSFGYEFARAVNGQDLPVNFLLSLREDALGELDRFKGPIPFVFDNCLRLQHLDPEAAREAIKKPIAYYNTLDDSPQCQIGVEPTLVDEVLRQVEVGKVNVRRLERGVVRYGDQRDRFLRQIETPYLQLVMTCLWEEEMQLNSRTLRLSTLERLGGAQRIARTHLDKLMDKLSKRERRIAASLFYYLVTPNGFKIAHTAHDLVQYTKCPEPDVGRVLAKLSDSSARILRSMSAGPDQGSIVRFEIFHDVLAPAIIDWHHRFVGQRLTVRRVADIIAEFTLVAMFDIVIIVGLFVLARVIDWLVFGFRMLILWLNDRLFELLFGP